MLEPGIQGKENLAGHASQSAMQIGTGETGWVYCCKNQPTLVLTLKIIPVPWRLCPQLKHPLAYRVRELPHALSNILKRIHCHPCLTRGAPGSMAYVPIYTALLYMC